MAQRSLFGGALVSAGLVTPPVLGQSFDLSRTMGNAYVVEYAGPSFDFDSTFSYGPFAVQSNANSDGSSIGAQVSGNAMTIRASAFINDKTGFGARGFGGGYAYFTVDQDVTAGVQWDWTHGGSYGYAYVTDLSTGQLLLDTTGHTFGSQPLSLLAGHDYRLLGVVGVLGGTQQSFWKVSIPAPGTLGLLAAAGMVASRLRRR